jgi:DNA-binding SARP family transcriptional activator
MIRNSAVQPDFHVHLLGEARFLRAGVPYRFSAPPKTLPLLAYLALNADAYVARDQLAYVLWPDDGEDGAKANLRRHLHRLQQALPTAGVPLLLTGAGRVRLNPAANIWYDVTEYQRALDGSGTLEQAVDLYGGDLLAAYYDDWILPVREHLRSRYLDALTSLIARFRSERDLERAAGYAQAVLATDRS